MSMKEWAQPSVHPEVRAYVASLVSALGGPDPYDDGRYKLGDEPKLCLLDIRKWLKTWDEGTNRQDVARALAEADFVAKDALEIISTWHEGIESAHLWQDLSLRCLELVTMLTWPLKIKGDQMTIHNHKQLPYLALAQVSYKKAILQHDSDRILKTAIRLALPPMAISRRERSARDEGIINIVLAFLLNIARIAPTSVLPPDVDESDISRSALIDVFEKQDVFALLLTISSSLGTNYTSEFENQDVTILELLFHLVKGVDAEKLFMEEKQLATANIKELQGLIQKEKTLLSGNARHAPTRHNRFGTMIWVKRDDDRMSTVTGQDFLGDAQRSLIHMDKSKKWNRPRFRNKRGDFTQSDEFDLPTLISDRARGHLRSFVADFIDSSFNPFFEHLRKTIDREAKRVLDEHLMQYVYVMGWFLRAESARRKAQVKTTDQKVTAEDSDAHNESFSLISTALTPESFVLLNRYMQSKIDDKAWNELNAGMKCFTQVLLTIQDMAESPYVFDVDVSENLQNRIFYEETTHDRIIHILRSYNDQGFGYLDACTELAHVFLRLLEQYSKQNVDLQVRSRRRARRKRKAADGNSEADTQAEQQDDVEQSQKVVRERKFDFQRFAAKFTTQACVNTFVAMTKYYNDLSAEQLKRAHRYFYRVAFKMELGIILYRVDILQLFHKMIKGPSNLDPDLPIFKEWEELIKQISRRAIKKLQERPEMIIEMLFSKMPSTMFYLEHGYEKEVARSTPRAPAELEVKPGMDKEEQLGVAVGILINQNKSDSLAWIKRVLESAAQERKAWEEAALSAANTLEQSGMGSDETANGETEGEVNKADPPSILVKTDNEERKTAIFKDNKLRLLMELLDLVRVGDREDPEASWIIPSNLTSEALLQSVKLIGKFEFAPPTYEDGKSAQDFIRSKAAGRSRNVERDEDSESTGTSDEEDPLLPLGGPTARIADHNDVEPRRRRRLKRKRRELDDAERDQRRKAREEAEKDKRRKIKSSLFVNSDDDLTDEERDRDFFAKEAALRQKTQEEVLQALASSKLNSLASRKRKNPFKDTTGRKRSGQRRESPFSDAENDSERDTDDEGRLSNIARQSSPVTIEDEDRTISMDETPISSHRSTPSRGTVDKTDELGSSVRHKAEISANKDLQMDESDEDSMPIRVPRRRTVRAGFVIESDSE